MRIKEHIFFKFDDAFYLREEADRNRKTNWCFALQSVPLDCFAMEHSRHITQSDGKWLCWVQEQTKSHWDTWL